MGLSCDRSARRRGPFKRHSTTIFLTALEPVFLLQICALSTNNWCERTAVRAIMIPRLYQNSIFFSAEKYLAMVPGTERY